MKSNQEWVDEYAKLREENNMVNSISKLIDMVKAEFAAHPPAPAGMEEAVRGLDNPYPLSIVLGFLIKATEYLLNKNNYDGPDYEEMEISVKRAKEIIANLSASTPAAKDNWVKIEEGGKMPEEGQEIIYENIVGAIWRTKFYGFDKGYIRWMPYTPPTT